MSTKRIRHTARFKFQIAIEAIKTDKTINQLAGEHQLHPSQISQWKRQLLEQGSDIFATTPTKRQRAQNDRESSLYEQIGRLNIELDWLKKKLPQTAEQRRKLVEPNHPQLSIRRQCELLGLSRSTLYCQPATESKENLHLMRRIDQQYMQTPFKAMKEGVPNKFNEAPEPEVENKGLSDDQVRAIPLITEGKTDAQVGEALGKRRETINRWRNQDKHFIKELQTAREAYLDAQITALSATTPKVITVLQDLLDSEDEKIRMQAATHLLKVTALSERMKYGL